MKLRIVIADDHPVVRIGACAIVNTSGVGDVVGEADSAEGLLALLEVVACDVLVTDFSMPGGKQPDGLAMLNTISRRHPDLPIILLSTTTNLGLLRLAMSAGVLALVDKASSSLQELPAAIQSAHRNKSYISTGLRQRIAELEEPDKNERRPLSPRETEVLRMLSSGLSVTQIATQLHRSVTTISRQKVEAMKKLGVLNDAELFSFLQRQGLP